MAEKVQAKIARVPRGKSLPWSGAELDQLSEPGAAELKEANGLWHEAVEPRLKGALDAKPAEDVSGSGKP